MAIKVNEFKIPTIVLSHNLDSNAEARKALVTDVREACEKYGCFLIKYDEMTLEKQRELSEAMKSLFDFPREKKELFKMASQRYGGYMGTNPHRPFYESFGIYGQNKGDINTLANLMWPQGNPSFCEVMNFMNSMFQNLTSITLRLVFEALGIKKHFAMEEGNVDATQRLAKYHPIEMDKGESLGISAHVDKSVFTFICQNGVQGLEMKSSDGNWNEVVIPDNCLFFQFGDLFEVWSNGIFNGLEHRVMIKGVDERYTYSYFVKPKDDAMIEVPSELVSDEHPLRYRSFLLKDYTSTYGLGALKSYAGI